MINQIKPYYDANSLIIKLEKLIKLDDLAILKIPIWNG